METETQTPATNLIWTRAATITAWRLAHAHGHGWAETPTDVFGCLRPIAQVKEDGSLDLEATEAAQAAHEGDGPGLAGLRPRLYHRTATGRSRWIVKPDGEAEITICRPGDVEAVFGEVMSTTEHVDIWVDVEVCEARHVVAFLRAMLVVVGCNSISSLVYWTDPTCGARQVPTLTSNGVDFPWPDLSHLRGAHCEGQACETALELAAVRWLGDLDHAEAERSEQAA